MFKGALRIVAILTLFVLLIWGAHSCIDHFANADREAVVDSVAEVIAGIDELIDDILEKVREKRGERK